MPGRMVARFVEQAIHQRYNRRYNRQQMTDLVIETCRVLQTEFPHLTPRSLDHLIWNFMA
ncbi:MAG TPA: hypothetical protein VI451_15715 [Anaerolineales bacterium]|nr:hypothetical protein [Anaerolineales bacterium]